jgi:MFS family permease
MSLGRSHAVHASAAAQRTRFGRSTFSALRHYNFRLFWFGQIVSVSGTWMQSIGQSWLVLELTRNAFLLGLVTALQFLPLLVFSLLGGVVADRLPKRPVLVFTQSASAVLAIILYSLAATGVVQVWHIMLLALLLGCVNALDMPTRQAFISEMVSRDDLMNAISLNSAQFNAARVVGPGVAAALIAVMGIPPLFLVNALSYLAVIVGLLLMDPSRLFTRAAAPLPVQRPLRQVREGLIFAWRTPPIQLTLIVLFFIGTFGMNFNITLPLLADFVYHSGASGYGLLSSAMGVGALIAALGLASLVKRPNVTLLVASGTGFGVLLLVLAVTRTQSLAYLVLLFVGLATIAFSATSNTLLQTSSPDQMRGRVMGLYAMVFAGTTPIGALTTGWLASAFGAPATLAIVAIPCLASVAFAWIVRDKTVAAQTALLAQLEREQKASSSAPAANLGTAMHAAGPRATSAAPVDVLSEEAIAD